MFKKVIYCISVYLLSSGLPAADLVELFNQAQYSDPIYKQAIAAYNAATEAKPQARSQLLPQISLNANTYSHDQDISSSSGIGGSGTVDFNTHGYSLDLTQPVFHYDRWLALRQADNEILQAQAEQDAALQELIIRVSERYFNLLAANDNLEFVRAEKSSLARQLEQATQRFEVGLSTITDVHEAQAGYDSSVANEILAENQIDNAREALWETTGTYVDNLSSLGESMALVQPQPGVIDEWTEIARVQNLQVIAAQYQLEQARQEISIQRSGHLPSLDIVANRGYNTSGGRFGGTETHSTAIGLELSVPLYEGGLVNSLTREAQHLHTQALERLEQEFRAAQRDTREAYLGVISGISQVNALKQSVISNESALQATEAGFEVGTRTAVDVVAVQRSLSQAKRDYARARYNYVMNTLRLKQASGTLSPEDLYEVNKWLE